MLAPPSKSAVIHAARRAALAGFVVSVASSSGLAACSAEPSLGGSNQSGGQGAPAGAPSSVGGNDPGSGGASSAGAPDDGIDTGASGEANLGGAPVPGGVGPGIVLELPPGFTASEGARDGSDRSGLRGGFDWVGPLEQVEDLEARPDQCSNILRVLMRDFPTYGHPDFGGEKPPSNAPGLVRTELGKDRKPSRSTAHPSVAVAMDDWYNHRPLINRPFVVDLWLEPDGNQFTFDSSRFFPLDRSPKMSDEDGTQPDFDGEPRNFGFTTELHTSFRYRGGEVFSFRGDDDVFVYINGALVVDLGGVHGPLEGTVDVDSLGLNRGEAYPFDLFQAERNPVGSNFRLETSLDFEDCGVILPDDILK